MSGRDSSKTAAQGVPGLLPTASVIRNSAHGCDRTVTFCDRTVTKQRAAPAAVSTGASPTLSRVQEVLDVSNDVAAELAAVGDGVLDALRDRLECTILLRGNRLTIEGEEVHVSEARAVVD